MGNDIQSNPIKESPVNGKINLQRMLPKKEWWTIWHYIFTGKLVKLNKEKN
jgi:hypothetical protein